MRVNEFERERYVREQERRRWTPPLMVGAMICYALTGFMAVAMMAEPVIQPEFVCGIGPPFVLEARFVPQLEAEIQIVEAQAPTLP